jgi:hypothetical protein
MTIEELLDQVRGVADAFVRPIEGNFWTEHGIDDGEAEEGALSVLRHLGIFSDADVRKVERHWKAVELLRRRESARRERKRRAGLTEKAREQEDQMNSMMRTAMQASTMFMRNALLDMAFKKPGSH